MIAGIILAAGKGTRIKSRDRNKVTLSFLNKPIIVYGVELLSKMTDKVIVVIGAFHESVKEALKSYQVTYAYQTKRLGTGHAVKVALSTLEKKNIHPEIVLVAYGDHTMFYKKETISELIRLQKTLRPAMSIITTDYDKPKELYWGKIIRDKDGLIIDSIEFKDATEVQKKIIELNAGFYCFDFNFLKKNLSRIAKSEVSGEYYINSLIKIAVNQRKKVISLKVPFENVGIGINKPNELEESQKLYLKSMSWIP